MKILWLTWKDLGNPLAGGAERVNEEIAKRLVENGHEVVFLTANFPGGMAEETVDGYKVIRLGNRWSVYWKAYRFYTKHMTGWADLVIDEVNTMPFFAKFYVKEKNILFVHQLCREIWFYQMFFPLNLAGFALEPLYMRLFNDCKVITISDSTKKDLKRFGFKDCNIKIICEGTDIAPVKDIDKIRKCTKPTLLSFGSIRSMKRTTHILKAFEIAKCKIPDLELIIAGDNNNCYGRKVFRMAQMSKFSSSIHILGKVGKEGKIELMQKTHILLSTPVKEGWGLVVTEANSQGTPAIVYNVDGLRDSVRNNSTGIVCDKNTPFEIANNIISLLKNKDTYNRLRYNAWAWSLVHNFENSYKLFIKYIT
jgi:glycosyltransferase involved in cell wall biosynthesis